MTKPLIRWICKALCAGLLALALLCVFCFFYYNVPVHYPNPSGATEYVWEAHRFYSRGTEGFAMGRTNNEGFNDLFDYTPGDPIDILLMGSSHMEGFNTAQRSNAATVLNALFAGEKTVYNIGTAGHTLPYCVKHLDAALTRYAPARYVILETDTLSFSAENMLAAVDGTLAEIPSHNEGLIVLLQKLPYLRLLYTNLFSGSGLTFGGGDDIAAPDPDEAPAADVEQSMDAFLSRIASVSAAHGVRPILVYHPSLELQADGSGVIMIDPIRMEMCTRLCREQDILFVDLSARILDAYDEDAALAYGFSNTAPGIGHINALGHRLIAEAVYDAIEGEEG